jgi:hypothetical protein
MRWKTIQVALWIGIAALATEVIAAPQAMDAHASKISAILDRWQAVEANKGGDVALWRDMMSIQLKQVSPSTLDRLLALNSGSNANTMGEFYQSFIYTLGADIALRLQAQKAPAKVVAQSVASQAAAETALRSGMTDRVHPEALGSVGLDQTFTPITPCRVVDTRNVGGTIGAFATRNFFYYTTSAATNWNTIQGGVNGAAGTVCPGTVITGFVPSAAVATITVTGQGGAGNLIVWQGTSPVASASTMSYFASGDIASLAVVPEGGRSGTGPGGAVQDFGVFVNAFTSTNVVVDIVGYYTQPAATALDCVTQTNTGTIPTGFSFLNAASCPAGYTRTAIACETGPAAPAPNVSIAEVGFHGVGYCSFDNFSGSPVSTAVTVTRCCRVPGH